MAEENKKTEEVKKTEPKAEGKKIANLLIIGIFTFLITVVVAGTFLVITLKSPPPSPSPVQVKYVHAPGKESREKEKEEIGELVSVGEEMIVNIASETGEQHFLKVNITLELKSDKKGKKSGGGGHGESKGPGGPAAEEVTKRIPQIRDTVITILRSKTKEKIDEKEGKDLIRSEIISNINKYLISGKIKNVYFQDFVIQ